MCGIWGILHPRGDVDDAVAAMHAALAARGPDGDGIERTAAAILGHRRLSIIDLSAAGAQPMWDATGSVCIVFNGEIYNFRALRDELRAAGLEFHSQSDTEVILNAYVCWGEPAFARLDGMFAFCLLDARSGEAFLVRDPMGIKPLYYGRSGRGLVFASTLRALTASGLFPREIDAEALQAYVQLDFVPSPMAMIRGVRKLSGGERLRLRADGVLDVASFSTLRRDARPSGATFDDDVRSFDAVMHDVVRRQLVADVPVGVLLSGGIDSSIVARVAAEVAGKIRTFSIAFDDPTFDERRWFEEVARLVGSEHHTATLTSAEMVPLISELSAIAGEPLADGSIFPTILLSRFARQSVKVALSGDGADELFGGYPTHRVWRAGTLVGRLPRLRRLAARGAHAMLPVRHANLSAEFRVKKFLDGAWPDPILQNQRWLGSFDEGSARRLLLGFDDAAQRRLEALLHAECGRATPLEDLLHSDQRFYLQDGVLVKVDRASMSCALEVRVPFLDDDVVRFANGLTADRKIRGRESKRLLRAWARRHFPRAITERPKKGFGAPLAAWFAGELRPFVSDTLSPARVARQGLFDPAAVAQLLDDHVRGRRDERKKIFNLLAFTLWYDELIR